MIQPALALIEYSSIAAGLQAAGAGGKRAQSETTSVASTIMAADAGVKGAEVHLVEIRLGDGLGGKGIVLYSGLVADVEAAVEIGAAAPPQPGGPGREGA